MKIEQQKKFQPITITFETEEDAIALKMMVDYRIELAKHQDSENKNVHDLCKNISNWFSNEGNF